MAESLEQHYRRLLGLEEPWVVEAVDLDLAAQRVEIRLRAQVYTRGLKCPECRKWASLYDHAPERRWRHLDTMQFETVLVARTPRVNCPEHGVKTIEVPWAGKNSRFTLMFEAFAIRVLQPCETVSSGAGLLGLDWHSAHQIMERAVERGLQRRSMESVRLVGIDSEEFWPWARLCQLDDRSGHRAGFLMWQRTAPLKPANNFRPRSGSSRVTRLKRSRSKCGIAV